MNRNFKTSSMTEAAMISGILVIFAYLSWFVLPSLMIFYPIPAIILAKRKGFKYSVLSLIVSDIIISMLLGIQTGIYFLILLTPFGIVMSYCIIKDENPYRTIMMSAMTFLLSFVAIVLATQAIMGVNFVKQMTDIFNETMIIYKDMMSNMLKSDTARLDAYFKQLEDMSKVMEYMLSHLLPALLIVSSVVTTALNYFIARWLGKRFKIDIRKSEGFSMFSFPRTFIIAMAVLLLLSFLMSVFNINVQIIQMNIFMISFFAMFVQGLAVLKFYLQKMNVSRLVMTLIIITVIIMAEAGIMLALVGIADLIFDLRKIRHKVV